MFFLQGDPGPMVPKGNIRKQKKLDEILKLSMNLTKFLELTDSKSPKVRRKKKKEDHDYPAQKKVSMCVGVCSFYR